MSEIPPPDPADEAAKAGRYIDAVVTRLGAMFNAGVERLQNDGAFVAGVERLAAEGAFHSAVLKPSAMFAAMVDDPSGLSAIAAACALDFIRSAPSPSLAEPWPSDFAAAHVLVDLYVFRSRYRTTRRRMIQGKVDLNDIAELVWVAMRIGALSEGFRAHRFGYEANLAKASELMRKEAERVAKSGGAMKAKALSWRELVLPSAQAARAKNPRISQDQLAQQILAMNPRPKSLPQIGRIKAVLSEWEKVGGDKGLVRGVNNPRLKA